MPVVRQTSFIAGELAPYLWGRTDLPTYAHGLRRALNFFVDKRGPALSRPGTEFLAQSKHSAGDVPRLVPFVYSEELSFVLEIGEGYMRIFSGGTPVMNAGVPLELVTPWSWFEIQTLQWAQVGAVLTVVQENHPPYEIARNSAGAWSCSPVTHFSVWPQWREVPSETVETSPPKLVNVGGSLFAEDADNKLLPWVWLVSAVIRVRAPTYSPTVGRGEGMVFETRPVAISQYYDGSDPATTSNLGGALVVVGRTKPVKIRRHLGMPAVADDGLDVLRYNYYRGLGKVFGFVGSESGLTFVDDGREPNWTIPPLDPVGTESLTASWPYGHPSAVAYFQERRVFAGPSKRPGALFASASGNYLDHDSYVFPWEGMPIDFELASRRREHIRAMVALDRLLVLTDSSVWSFAFPAANESTPDARVIDEEGSAKIQPIVANGRILYVHKHGRSVRMLVPSQEGGAYASIDVSEHASHIFAQRKIVDWAYASHPHGVIWVVFGDGSLASGTVIGNSVAWARHYVGGNVFAVATVPEVTPYFKGDAVYLFAYRNERACIERMAERLPSGIYQAMSQKCVDSFSNGFLDLSEGAVFTGLARLIGKQAWVVADGNDPVGPLTVDGYGQVRIPPMNANHNGATLFAIGAAFTCELETLDLPSAEARMRQSQVVSVGFEVESSAGLMVGQDSNHLVPWKRRLVSEGYDAISAATELVKVQVPGTWGQSSRAVLRQPEPRWVTVLGISREVAVGG